MVHNNQLVEKHTIICLDVEHFMQLSNICYGIDWYCSILTYLFGKRSEEQSCDRKGIAKTYQNSWSKRMCLLVSIHFEMGHQSCLLHRTETTIRPCISCLSYKDYWSKLSGITNASTNIWWDRQHCSHCECNIKHWICTQFYSWQVWKIHQSNESSILM